MARTYESPLRAEQLERTRRRIVEAAADVLAVEGEEALTIPLVAERAGVAVRTVYRHFATKDELVRGIGHLLDERFAAAPFPDDADGLVERVPRFFAGFEANDALVRAAFASPRMRTAIAGRRDVRHAAVERIVGELAPRLSPRKRRARAAALYALSGLNGWHTFHEQFGLDAKTSGEAAQWAIRALLDALEREGR